MTGRVPVARRACAASLAAVLLAGPLSAQTGAEPRLVFTVFGGLTHHGQIWSIERQPLTTAFSTLLVDTLRLQRQVTPGVTAGVTASLFRSSDWGLQAEAAYLGIRLDDTCRMIFTNLDVQNRGLQICNDITQQVRIASTTSFTVGGVWRFLARAQASPYVRAAAGLAVRSSTVIAMSGRYTWVTTTGTLLTSDRAVIEDRRELRIGPTANAGAGLVIAFSRAYHVRLEARDHLLFLDRPLGPANELLRVETESALLHFPTFLVGMDIVLEQGRGRRY